MEPQRICGAFAGETGQNGANCGSWNGRLLRFYYEWGREYKGCRNERIFIEMKKAPVKYQWFY